MASPCPIILSAGRVEVDEFADLERGVCAASAGDLNGSHTAMWGIGEKVRDALQQKPRKEIDFVG